MGIYTMENWREDGTFSAAAGQEVEEVIYEEMLNVLPPLRLPQEAKNGGYTAGFMVSEPYCSERSKSTGQYLVHYSAFGKKGGKYYFLGYMNKLGEILDRGIN